MSALLDNTLSYDQWSMPTLNNNHWTKDAEEPLIPTSKLLLPKETQDYLASIGRSFIKTVADYELFVSTVGMNNQHKHKTSLQGSINASSSDCFCRCDYESYD